jgi:hypothetical protein
MPYPGPMSLFLRPLALSTSVDPSFANEAGLMYMVKVLELSRLWIFTSWAGHGPGPRPDPS